MDCQTEIHFSSIQVQTEDQILTLNEEETQTMTVTQSNFETQTPNPLMNDLSMQTQQLETKEMKDQSMIAYPEAVDCE